ncbi:MAG: UDP-2,3-diacylglucosamine diphosphatase [Burkholderiales bacterium]|nr:UDP-2,3-diacylglucosamine diphosphatase [Burkholderiales bacterium]
MSRALLVSDLHLAPERPRTSERFFRFLREEAAHAQALYVLGDLFEYWIGDDALDDPAEEVGRAVAQALASLARAGVAVYLMHGNRDFLLGARFCAEAGARLLEDPARAALGGEAALLLHGDTLCTDDLDYQAWRRTARSADWQRQFLARPLAERRRILLGLREQSKAAVRAKPPQIMDVNEAAVRAAFRTHGVARMVHGHTHRPARHAHEVDGRRCERWVLPDWYERGGYLAIDADGPRLVSL